MRVAIDLRRNSWAPQYGISRYGRSLFRALGALAGSPVDAFAIDLAGAGTWPADRTLAVGPGHSMGRRIVQEQVDIPRVARGVDLLHLPWSEGPVRLARPTVVTIFDVDTLVNASAFNWKIRAYYNGLLRLHARQARRVITTSQATAGELAARWPRLAIDVIPCGVDDVFSAHGSRPADAPDGPFVLYPGGYGPRKRIDDLLAAFEQLAAADPALTLVMTGAPPAEVAAKLQRSSAAARIRAIGYVDDEALASWYRAATVIAYPSLLEGFGLPVVEAFASGVPVVATEAGSIPEVAGGAATLVPIGDVGALAGALGALLASTALREERAAAGLSRAADFAWPTVAAATVVSYEAALA